MTTIDAPTAGEPVRAPRPARPQLTLEVVRRERLNRNMVRLVLSGEQFDAFPDNGTADRYVKLYFAKPELGLEPPYDIAALRESLAPEDLPVTRTYTVRSVDPHERTLSIDVVVHGTEGIAGPWAAAAEPGDRLTFAGPGGTYSPDPHADWHLFVADQSALPATASALETLAALAPDARGIAFLFAADDGETLELTAPAGVEIRWVLGSDVGALVDAVDGATWLPGRPQVFAHGERGAIKRLRDVFRQRGVRRAELSLSGYWAIGRTEDRFQAEKREPIGAIAPLSD